MRREEAQARERQEVPKPYIKVTKLTFRGQTAVPPDQISRIAQSLTERRYEDDSGWREELLAAITDAWQHLGYFRAAVADPRVRQLDEGTPVEKRVAVSVAVEAGRVYRLDRITFANGTQFSADELRASFPIQDGDVLDTHALQQGLENLRKAYGARGFINSLVVPSFDINEPHGLVKLNFEIDEGKQFRFGEVKVLGLDPGLAQDLLRRSGLKRGNVFDWTLLEKFFKDNVLLLPKDAISFDDTQRRINEEQATVDITMDFRGCPQLPDE
jgi:outer membrane protein assembly factor BamA